ncbi:MAG: acyl-ACP--UDP-N-acetylglucosamine O-acyltransferase [Synergistaceae bacterium]
MATVIHPTAIVSKKSKLGMNIEIGPFCVVDDNVTLGDGTILKPYAHVCDYTEVGAGCTFYDHSVIGGAPQDLSYAGEVSWAKIGNGVVCREFVTVNRATGENNVTQIGDSTYIMENVHIAHNVEIGSDCTIANKTGIAGHVIIGNNVVIGGMCGIHQFVQIGSYSMLGGMSRLTQDVPPFALASGNPCYFYDINKVGLRRRGFDSSTRTKIREIYKLIYSNSTIKKDAMAYIADNFKNDSEASLILEFMNSATRGIVHSIKQDWNHNSPKEGQVTL